MSPQQIVGLKVNTVLTVVFGLLVSGIGLVNELQLSAIKKDQDLAIEKLHRELETEFASKQVLVVVEEETKENTRAVNVLRTDVATIKTKIKYNENQ